MEDSGSGYFTSHHGYAFLEINNKSILYHPVGLPLVAAFDGQDLANLPSAYPVKAFPPETWTNENGNTIFSDVVSSLQNSKKIRKKTLIKRLYEQIELAFPDQFSVETERRMIALENKHCVGQLDLAFLPKLNEGQRADTPLCVVEVGLSGNDFWEMFDRGTAYLGIMRQQREVPYCFDEPMLLVIIKLDGKIAKASHDFNFKMGVFLCSPSNKHMDFPVSLIWRKEQTAVEDASMSFGLLLRILDHFQTHRSKKYEGEAEYFGPNCVKAGDMVSGGPVLGRIINILHFVSLSSRALTTSSLVLAILLLGFAIVR